MQTIREYISQIQDGLRVSTDDTTIYDEMVYNQFQAIVLELMRQESDKGRLDEVNAQPLFNLELQQVDISECSSFMSGSKILKGVKKLPKIIDNQTFGKLIFSVYTNTGTVLDYTTFQNWMNHRRKIHSMKVPSYFIRNDFPYVVNYDETATCLFINMLCFFEDPVEVELLSNPCVYVPDLPFHIPGYIANRAIEMTKDAIRRSLGIASDVRGNAKEELTPNP